MTDDEIRKIVHQVLVEERQQNADRMDETVIKTISAILTGFGINNDERKEIAEDFRYLRKWRQGSERLQGVGWTALVTLFAGGIASALYLGVKAMLGKP